MNAIVNTRYGAADVLRLEERPDPTPAKDQVRIRVAAAGLNPAEVSARQGLYPDAPSPPMVVGYEVSGVVESLGEGVRAFSKGDRVWGLTRFGGHAEVVCTPAAWVRKMPERLSFETAAAIPVAYATAMLLVNEYGRVREGDSVLVHMAAGSVGLATAQLCRQVRGVRLIGCASAAKHPLLLSQGFDAVIDPSKEDFEARGRELTQGRGVDLILDPVGGRYWKKNYRLLAPLGRLMLYGFSGATGPGTRSFLRVAGQLVHTPLWIPLTLMDQNKAVMGLNLGHLFTEDELIARGLDTIARLTELGAITPLVDSVFPFSKVVEAHHRLESRQNVGKVVLVPDSRGELL
jgi:NADPH:quinone reductase-like Zn-dependent oxidoreductase